MSETRTPQSDYLLALGKRLLEPYTKLPGARAAMITGSVDEGISDHYSDFDMMVYYENELPDDETALGYAREWLRTAGLLPNNVDDGTVVSRSEETQRVIVQFIPLEPENLVAAYPSAVVTIGPNGEVIEASVRWPVIDRYDIYQLREPTDAWAEVASGEAFLDQSAPAVDRLTRWHTH